MATPSRRTTARRATFVALATTTTALMISPASAYVWSDRQTMEYLYKQMGGETWNRNKNWGDVTQPVCNWEGITCRADAQDEEVQAIDLTSNNLKGVVPLDKLLQMPHLETLKMSGNAITLGTAENGQSMPDPGAASSTTPQSSLKYMDLSDCNIDSIDAMSASGVTFDNLIDLNLSRNKVRGPFPPALHLLTNLERLSLENNDLTGSLPEEGLASSLKNLQYFSAHDNELGGGLPESLGSLTNLRFLLLRGNRFSGTIPETMNGLTLIEFLDLAQQGVDRNAVDKEGAGGEGLSGPLPAFDQLKRIRRLDLAGNALSGPIPADFLSEADKQTFEYAFLGSNQLTGTVPSTLQRLKTGNVFLEDNMISAIDPELCSDDGSSSVSAAGGVFGCDGFLCKPGTYNEVGRQESQNSPCLSCPNSGYYGATTCPDTPTGGVSGGGGGDGGGGFTFPTQETFAPIDPTPDPSLTEMIVDEKSILQSLFHRCGGVRWSRNENWQDETKSPCDYQGITCTESSKSVRSINLSSNSLVGTPPSEIFTLPNLEVLSFDGNTILFLFDGIEKARRLKRLDLSQTGLYDLTGIEKAVGLEELAISSNSLGPGPIPKELVGLTTLQELSMDFNEFEGGFPDDFDQLLDLKVLSCANCGLSGYLPDSLGKLKDLTTLRLEHNKFKGALPGYLEEDLTMLRNLDLSNQRGSDDSNEGFTGPLLAFDKSPDLFRLDVSHNGISGQIPPTFLDAVDKEMFQMADLSSNALSGIVPGSIGRIIGNILLADNKIVGIDPMLCETSMGGNIATYGCDAILCESRTFHMNGRQESPGEPCQPCTDATFFGQVDCGGTVSDGTADLPGDLITGGIGDNTSKPGNGGGSFPGGPVTIPPPPSADTSDRNVLENLYLSTDGPNWSDRLNWLDVNKPICDWYGIKCADTEKEVVSSIILKSNNLQNTIPPEIFDLPHLETLVLDGNTVDIDLTNVGKAKMLKILDLSHTQVSSLQGLEGAQRVSDLHLVSTRISGEFPPQLYEMINLERLSLDFNSISGPLTEEIGNLSKLEYLSAHSNSMNGQLPEGLGSLTELSFLLLQDNGFSGSIPSSFGNLKKLWFLDLSDMKGDGLSGPLPSFIGFSELRRLDLSRNSLSGSVPSDFLNSVNKQNFEYVDVSANKLGGALPGSLTRLPVSSFFFEGNQITGVDESLCAPSLGGAVGVFGCDSILCTKGTFNSMGRQVSQAEPCEPCPNGLYFGMTSCGDESVGVGDGTDGSGTGSTSTTMAPPATSTNDRDILEKFYNACGGPNWHSKGNWLETDNICDWFGIRCVDNSQAVEFIMLSSNNLVGTPPPELFDLPYMDTLILDSNAINFSFDGIANAKKLKTLDLSATGLSSLSGIDASMSLTDLHISSNNLAGEISSEVFLLTNLEQLAMDFNKFSGNLPESIGRLTNMKLLSIAANGLTGALPEALSGLKELTTIRLQFNSLSGSLPISAFSAMTSLTVVDLSSQNSSGGPGISGSLPDFVGLKDLRRLDLSGNVISGPIPETFLTDVNPTVFEFADLSNNKIGGKVPSSLSKIIHNVFLEGNEITEIDESLCKTSLGGSIAEFGCDAIMCPPNTYSNKGRQESSNSPCLGCTGAEFYGTEDCSSSTTNGSNRSDRDILELFYQECGGYYWRNNDNWMDKDKTICQWFGITCVGNSEVVESIKLGSNNVVRTPPAELFNLPQLQELSLYSNPISFSFDGIENAMTLTHLFLDATNLKSLNGIGKAPALQELNARFNNLKGTVPKELTSVKTLQRLSLSHNLLEGPLPYNFDAMSELEDILISDNKIRSSLNGIRFPDKLQILDLSSNELTGAIPSTFLENVIASNDAITIDLSENKLVGIIPSSLSRFPAMNLFIRNNLIDDVSPALCSNKQWNFGDVGRYGCDGLFCPKGKSSQDGRQAVDGAPCRECPEAFYVASTACHSSEIRAEGSSPASPSHGAAIAFALSIVGCVSSLVASLLY